MAAPVARPLLGVSPCEQTSVGKQSKALSVGREGRADTDVTQLCRSRVRAKAEAGIPPNALYRCRSTGKRPFAGTAFFPLEDLF